MKVDLMQLPGWRTILEEIASEAGADAPPEKFEIDTEELNERAEEHGSTWDECSRYAATLDETALQTWATADLHGERADLKTTAGDLGEAMHALVDLLWDTEF